MKKIVLITTAAFAAVAFAFPSFAAGWQRDGIGWWWQKEDATYPKASWEWLDGNGDGTAECYYFDGIGYMASAATTPDGYQVDSDGHWIVNGVIQTKRTGAVGSSKNNPYKDIRTVTGRYDITSSGAPLQDAYITPIDKTDVTAINDPDGFCELMNQYIKGDDSRGPGNNWKVDWNKPVVKSGVSNIYYDLNSFPGDSRDGGMSYYAALKTSKSRPIRGNQGDIYEIRVFGFENGYLLVNTIRNGVYFNERGETVINGAIVKHTNYCYYGDPLWSTTLAAKREFYWKDSLTYNGYPIFYHNRYMNGTRDKQETITNPYIKGYGFGDCCNDIYEFHY